MLFAKVNRPYLYFMKLVFGHLCSVDVGTQRVTFMVQTFIDICFTDDSVAVPWLRWLVVGLSLRSPGFSLGSIHVGFVVDKVALGQVFLRVFRFSPVSIIPPSFSVRIYHLVDEQYFRQWQRFRDVVSPRRSLQVYRRQLRVDRHVNLSLSIA
jgi:hypothetical protein